MDEIKENPAAENPQPAPETKPAKNEAPQPEKPVTAPAEPKKEALPKRVKPSTCTDCGKPIKKKRWYYRNGKFYCNKRCWSVTEKKIKASDKESPAATQG